MTELLYITVWISNGNIKKLFISKLNYRKINGLKHFDIVLFDLGKTLLYFHGDSQEVFLKGKQRLFITLKKKLPRLDATQFLLEFDHSIQAYYLERDEGYVEYTTYKILERCLEDSGYPHVPPKLLHKALEGMYSFSERFWHPAEDTIPTLKILKKQGYKIGVISNAGDAKNAHRLIDRNNLSRYMDFILISAEIGVRKPAPLIYKMALDHLGASPQDAVMVGDTLRADILGAQQVGMAAIWITRQADTPQNNEDRLTILPDASIYALKELPYLISNWPNQVTNHLTA